MARGRLVAISSLLIAFTVAATPTAPPPPPVFKISQHSFKTFHFNWSGSVSGYHYNLLRSDDGGASYEEIASNLGQEWIEEIAAHEFDWLNTRYVVEMCDGKCSRSAPVHPQSYELTGRVVAPEPLARTRLGSQLDLSGNGLTLAATRGPIDRLIDGAVLFYATIPGETPSYLDQIRPPAADGARDFGASIALDDAATTLAVSAPAAHAIYVYECEAEDSCTWSLRQRLDLSRTALLGQVALSRDGVMLAAATDSGVLMFGCTSASCIQLAVLRPSAFKTGPIPAVSLALDTIGRTLVVGVPDDLSGAGEAYVFQRSGTSWREIAILRAADAEVGAEFGTSVAIDADGGTIAVGAPGAHADAGAVYVFEGVGSTTLTQSMLEAPIADAGDRLGTSLALNTAGDYVVAGATGEDGSATEPQGNPYDNSNSNSGAVYSFVRDGSEWEHSAYIKGYAEANASYGAAIAIDATGHTLAVGAPGDDGLDYETPAQTDSGRVHLY